MQTRQIDPQDEGLLAKYQDVAHRAEMRERPWEHMWSLDELKARFDGPNSNDISEIYCTFDGDRVVGGAFVEFPLLDNTEKVFAHVSVDPELRRRGIGTGLVEFVVVRCEQEGRSTIVSETSYPFDQRDTHPHRLFLEANGFTLANTEVYRELRLPVPEETLEAMAAECAPYHEDYGIETYIDEIPEEYVASYCYLLNQLVLDAPQGDLEFEEQAITPQVYREETARLKAAGRSRYSTLAIDSEAVVVGHTDLVLPANDPSKVLQWGTLVRRDHRGHRLGAALKVANLRAVQADHPERTRVSTSNAEENPAMVGINDRVGFVPVALRPDFQRKIGCV